MLTEISWWGGLLFLWWAATYRIVLHGRSPFTSVSFFASYVVFAAVAVLLALYFYPLAQIWLQLAYMGCLGVALLAFVVSVLWPESEEEALIEAEQDEEEESSGGFWTAVGNVVLYGPQVIPCLLAASKCWELAKGLHWIG